MFGLNFFSVTTTLTATLFPDFRLYNHGWATWMVLPLRQNNTDLWEISTSLIITVFLRRKCSWKRNAASNNVGPIARPIPYDEK